MGANLWLDRRVAGSEEPDGKYALCEEGGRKGESEGLVSCPYTSEDEEEDGVGMEGGGCWGGMSDGERSRLFCRCKFKRGWWLDPSPRGWWLDEEEFSGPLELVVMVVPELSIGAGSSSGLGSKGKNWLERESLIGGAIERERDLEENKLQQSGIL